jgi:hypothetical protein
VHASSVDVFVRFRSCEGSIISHHIVYPSIIPLNSFVRRGYRFYNTALTRKVLTLLLQQKTSRVVGTYCITQHVRHLTDGRSENTSGANALMLMPDKLKLPDCVGHEPFLVSRPEGSTRKMQSPKKVAPSKPHRYRFLYWHKVSKETREGLRE